MLLSDCCGRGFGPLAPRSGFALAAGYLRLPLLRPGMAELNADRCRSCER